MLKISNAKNIEEFTKIIENKINDGCDPMDAILTYCDENKVEIETVASFIKNSPIKTHILKYANDHHMMKKK